MSNGISYGSLRQLVLLNILVIEQQQTNQFAEIFRSIITGHVGYRDIKHQNSIIIFF